jgi:plastocyanin
MKPILVAAALVASSSVASGQAAQSVVITLTEFKVAVPKDTVKAGPFTFRVKNAGLMNHAMYVRGPGVDKGTRDIQVGQESPLAVTLKPGTYEVFCPLSDLAAGMTHTLVVTAADTPAPAAAPAKKKPGS